MLSTVSALSETNNWGDDQQRQGYEPEQQEWERERQNDDAAGSEHGQPDGQWPDARDSNEDEEQMEGLVQQQQQQQQQQQRR